MIVYLKTVLGQFELHAPFTWPHELTDEPTSFLGRFHTEQSARDYADKKGWKVIEVKNDLAI